MKRLQVVHAGLTLLLLAGILTFGVLTLTGVFEVRIPNRAGTNERPGGAAPEKAAQTIEPGAKQPLLRDAPHVTSGTDLGFGPLGLDFKLLQWPEGLTLLIVEQGWGRTSRAGDFYSQSGGGFNTAGDQQYYEWRLQTTDGKTATFRIVPGKEYDLSKGALFVIKASGDKVEVHQLSRQLPTVPLDAKGCEEFLKNDAEVRKILGVGKG